MGAEITKQLQAVPLVHVSGPKPGGATLTIGLSRDASHRYWLDGDRIPFSVTGVLGIMAKNGLAPWAAKLTAEYAVANADVLHAMVERGDGEAAVRWLKGEPFARRDRAAELGSNVHALAEAAASGHPIDVSDEERPFLVAFQRFCDDHQPAYRLVEEMVVSPKYGFAGTLDAIVVIRGETWLLDYKTSRGNGPYPETAMQLSAYANAQWLGRPGDARHYRIPAIDRYGVVQLRPNAYRLVEYAVGAAEFDGFLAALRLSQWVATRAKKVMASEDTLT